MSRLSGPLSFLASNTHLTTENPEFRTRIEPECGEDLFLCGLYLNLGAKVQTEIALLSLTKLNENILPPRNLLNQEKIDAYAHVHDQIRDLVRSSTLVGYESYHK